MPVHPQNYQPAPLHLKLGEKFYDEVKPANFPDTILRYRNQTAAETIGLDTLANDEWISHFGRFEPLEHNLSRPLALRYHGHQFRNYNHELGDGRGFLFAQVKDNENRLLDLGTKGSGQTPWSRSGDGRLTLKGGVREVLATELLTALGVYTSKSFSLVETNEKLERNDEPSPTRSSVLTRLNHSHIRIGTFQRQLFLEDHAAIEQLVSYSNEHYFPHANKHHNPPLAFFSSVVEQVAKLGAEWFAAGFVHGVLNTDNITITGESFDYGPWRFLPHLDPEFTAAYFDHSRLYAFGRQPDALYWNLARLAECLLPLCALEDLKQALSKFSETFETQLQRQTLARLGIAQTLSDTDPIVAQFYQTLRDSEAGYEQCFFDLTCGAQAERLEASPQKDFYHQSSFMPLIEAIRERELISDANDVLCSELMQRGRLAQTLIIDEVEAIWASIAQSDDWSLFEEKISRIQEYGRVNDTLLAYGIHR
ncbi:protein adenylyltransferase SelO [Lentilitoribacter sp. EG35]|uniref:protein adenylyltransferase SelO n=1 Tax=Lentilitoribacter sp. EG35 TaxID=3234192 RepID=UPI0034602DD1